MAHFSVSMYGIPWYKRVNGIWENNLSWRQHKIQKYNNARGKESSARNSSARKPVFQANFKISLAVFEKQYKNNTLKKTCTAVRLG